MLFRSLYQIHFWFQQALSYEKTPTLCGMVAAFEGYVKSLKDLQTVLDTEQLYSRSIIDCGIEKVEEYSDRIWETPGYVLSMGEWLSYKAVYFLIPCEQFFILC